MFQIAMQQETVPFPESYRTDFQIGLKHLHMKLEQMAFGHSLANVSQIQADQSAYKLDDMTESLGRLQSCDLNLMVASNLRRMFTAWNWVNPVVSELWDLKMGYLDI